MALRNDQRLALARSYAALAGRASTVIVLLRENFLRPFVHGGTVPQRVVLHREIPCWLDATFTFRRRARALVRRDHACALRTRADRVSPIAARARTNEDHAGPLLGRPSTMHRGSIASAFEHLGTHASTPEHRPADASTRTRSSRRSTDNVDRRTPIDRGPTTLARADRDIGIARSRMSDPLPRRVRQQPEPTDHHRQQHGAAQPERAIVGRRGSDRDRGEQARVLVRRRRLQIDLLKRLHPQRL